uniref:Bromodomain-containing protein 8 n=1 Tax=Scophthalmus maximus TaxID=52904 RepID=A0A8D3AMP1_SCOMX
MRSGDQNWVSVSRAIKPFSEPGRPPDWFSQKHQSYVCILLRPRRKRGEKGEVVETIEDVIVRRLTTERIEELKKLLRDTQEQYRKLKKEVDMIQTGHMDSQLKELWADITLKKKQDEEEAEQKRKATETAYQARQAVKNTPKRLPSVTVRSPLGASPPALDSQADSSAPTPPMDTGGGVGVFLPVADAPGPGPKDAGLAALADDSPQKRLLTQKATPPPSPLLSELLKKGNLISASPRLVAEGDSAGSFTNGLQTATAATALPAGHEVITGKHTLKHTNYSLMHTLTQRHISCFLQLKGGFTQTFYHSISIINYNVKFLLCEAEAAVKAELGEESVLVEEDLVAVSYMGDELDLETVGGIIAIIEEKVDDSVEALDAAAVEAALSLCEEAVSEGHTLPGPWETQELKASDPTPTVQDSGPTQEPQVMATVSAPAPASAEAQDQSESKREEQLKGNCEGPEVTGSDVTSSVASDDGAAGIEVAEEAVTGKEATEATVKSEGEEWSQPEPNPPCLDSEDSSVSGKESKEVKEEEAGSEGDPEEGMELKEECGEGPYLSEVERAASESEDGYGPPSQRYTADSLASSPASSSQLSTCGEDQEAVQAQKIWKKAIMLVWRAAANHRYASVFLQPVSDDIAPGYHSIVHRPMDLSAIKKNIESGVIRTTAEFQRDIMLMFQNAVMYNSSDHDVYHMALEMQRDVLEHVQQFLATQLIMQTSESAISAKSLRGREGNRKPGEPAEKVGWVKKKKRVRFIVSQSVKQDGGTRGRRSAMEADLKMKK